MYVSRGSTVLEKLQGFLRKITLVVRFIHLSQLVNTISAIINQAKMLNLCAHCLCTFFKVVHLSPYIRYLIVNP